MPAVVRHITLDGNNYRPFRNWQDPTFIDPANYDPERPENTQPALTRVGDDIWMQRGEPLNLAEKPLRRYGIVVRLPDGGLWLHSPVRLTRASADALREIGPIAHIVAPNRNRGAYIDSWHHRAMSAQLWVSPLFPRRHPKATGYRLLSNTAPAEWQEEFLVCLFPGASPPDEVVFLHRPSRTLILADLVRRQSITGFGKLWAGLINRRNSRVGDLGLDGRVLPETRYNIRHREAAKAARTRVLAWDFDRVVFNLDDAIETGGKRFFSEATAFLA